MVARTKRIGRPPIDDPKKIFALRIRSSDLALIVKDAKRAKRPLREHMVTVLLEHARAGA